MSLVRTDEELEEEERRLLKAGYFIGRTARGEAAVCGSCKITPEDVERRKVQIRASREMRHRKEALNGLRKELGSRSADMPKALPAPVPDPWYIRAIRSVRQWITDTERRTRPTVT